MNHRKIIVISTVIFAAALLGSGIFFAYQKFFKKNVAESTAPAEKNYYEINDELAGVSFKIGKKFDRMTAQMLQTKNPNFIYGFSADSDKTANCYISQTKREQGGQVSLSAIRDGVFEQIKKNNQDAKLDEAQIVEVGENNKGAKLKMSYADANQNNLSMLQWEVAGITDKTATFAFCVSPKAVIELYEDDFNLFLDSVRIK